jgi:hypothetical protein
MNEVVFGTDRLAQAGGFRGTYDGKAERRP